MRDDKPEVNSSFLQSDVPGIHSGHGILDEIVSQPLVERVESRGLRSYELTSAGRQNGISGIREDMIIANTVFTKSALQPRRVQRRGIRRQVCPKQVHRHAGMKIQITLNRRQVDDAQRTK